MQALQEGDAILARFNGRQKPFQRFDGDDHDGILATYCDALWSFKTSKPNDLAESGLGIFEFPLGMERGGAERPLAGQT